MHDAGLELEINRGGERLNDVPYFICGQRLYRLNRTVTAGVEFFTREDLGEILGTERVIMAAGLNQLAIVVPGLYYYVFNDSTDTISQITDSSFDGPFDSVVHVDSTFFLSKTDTKKIIQTSVNDATTTDATQFGIAAAEPTKIVRLFEFNGEMWAAGTEKLIPYRNIGGSGFVMQPVKGGILPFGLRSKHALVKIKRSFIFLSSGSALEPVVYISSGGTPEPISTEPVDNTIQNQTDFVVDNIFFLRYSKNGEDFILMTFGEKTFGYCYKASRLAGRKIWFERQSRIGEQDRAWRVNSIVQAYNKIYVGDAVDGRIGILDDQQGEEYGNPIIRELTAAPFSNLGRAVRCSQIESVIDGSGSAGYVSLSYSDDGHNFSTPMSLPLGDKGQYGLRTIWYRLGRFDFTRYFRFRTSSTVPPKFVALMGKFK